jgi:hypothetical protein
MKIDEAAVTGPNSIMPDGVLEFRISISTACAPLPDFVNSSDRALFGAQRAFYEEYLVAQIPEARAAWCQHLEDIAHG